MSLDNTWSEPLVAHSIVPPLMAGTNLLSMKSPVGIWSDRPVGSVTVAEVAILQAAGRPNWGLIRVTQAIKL